MIEDSFTAGYNWCVDTIKMSQHSQLANDLEINKAVMYLKQKVRKNSLRNSLMLLPFKLVLHSV